MRTELSEAFSDKSDHYPPHLMDAVNPEGIDLTALVESRCLYMLRQRSVRYNVLGCFIPWEEIPWTSVGNCA